MPTDLSGWTAKQRAERRKMYLDRELAHARHLAGQRERSMKCAGGTGISVWPLRHAGMPDGCANDGSSCLCECHDPTGDQP